MARHVKGSLFLDYVRMIKKRKQVDWSKYLTPEDKQFMEQMILPSQWYPLETYQRLGVAVLHEIAQGNVQTVRAWGKNSMDEIVKVYKSLIEKGDPMKALEKFNFLRGRFFDFEGLRITPQAGNRVQVMVDLAFSGVAEEAYAYQLLGSFERLLELSGAKEINSQFLTKAWEKDDETVFELAWK